MTYEASLQPPTMSKKEYQCEQFIYDLIQDVAHDIDKKGYRTSHKVLYNMLYMYIYENIEKFYPQEDVI